MGDYGRRVVDILNQYGAPGLQAKLFWNGPDGGDNYRGQVDAAKLWCNYLVSFHTDAAGNQDNDGRGYTGSMLCYSRHDPEGRRLGQSIQKRMKDDFNWPIAGEQERGGTLYVLDGLPQPSLLLEIGNHSDPEDCAALLSQQDDFCTAIAWGIFDHLGIKAKEPKKPEGDDDMIRIIDFDDGTDAIYLIDLGARTKWWIPSGEVLAWLRDGFGIPMITGMQPFGQFFDNIDLVDKEQDQRYQEIKVLMARAASSHSTGADASEIVDEISKRLAQ